MRILLSRRVLGYGTLLLVLVVGFFAMIESPATPFVGVACVLVIATMWTLRARHRGRRRRAAGPAG